MSADPIRARIDELAEETAHWDAIDALRAVLDLCDNEDGVDGWAWTTDVRRVIAECLGVDHVG